MNSVTLYFKIIIHFGFVYVISQILLEICVRCKSGILLSTLHNLNF